MEKAACKDADPNLFFPDKGQSSIINQTIVQFCFGCPVRKECKAYQKETGSDSGVWGGEYIGRGD